MRKRYVIAKHKVLKQSIHNKAFSFMDCRAALAMTRPFLAMTRTALAMTRPLLAMALFLLFILPGSLYAQSNSDEVTTITIKNARQTTYEKNEKNDTDSIVLEGAVEIEVKKGSTSSEIKADKVTYDRKTEMLFAEGGVEITTKSSGSGGGEKTTASSLLMNTSTLEGIFDDGRVVQTKSDALNLPSGSTLIVFSDIFGKSEDNTIAFKNSSLTFCDDPDPHWHIDASRTWLLPGGEFAFFNALLYVGPVPVLYFPAFYYPKDELVFNPVFGSRMREGKYVQTTTYLFGRKPLNSSSSSGKSSSGENEDSSTEESLKAVYNFMKPTELKEQELQGLMLHNLDESYKGDTSNYVKLLADWYTNLGGMLGIDGRLRPSSYITNLEFNTLFGFSTTVFQSGTKYTFLSNSGNRYLDKSNFMGLKLPFRYGANLKFTLSKPFNLSLSLPVYSDPYFYNDFKNREESMEWISYLLDLSNDSADSKSPVGSASINQLNWTLSASYSIPLPDLVKPYLNSISFNLNSSININSLNKSQEALKADSRYLKDNEWMEKTPERSFYYPSQVTPAKASLALNGTLFQWPLKQKTVTARKTNFEFPLAKPDELKSPKEIEEELKEKKKQEAEQNALEEDDSKQKEEEGEENSLEKKSELEALTSALVQLDTASFSAVTISGLDYKLDYKINPSYDTQIAYSASDSSGKTYLKTPEDFDWTKIRSSMYTIKIPLSINSSLGYGGSFFSMKNSLSYDPVWQKHPNMDGYSTKDQKNLLKADYSLTGQSLTNTNSISFKPFAYLPNFAETGITWNNTMKLYRKKFSGDADNPKWDVKLLDFDDTESITANSLSLILGMNERNSTFKQTLTLSSTLKPLTARYTGSLNLVFPYVSFTMSTGLYEKSKDDKTLQYSPLSQSMSLSLFNSSLKISESFSYVYNDNTDKKEKHAESLRLSLSYKQLSLSFSSSYTIKYDLFTDTANEDGKKGYVARKEKEFTPYSASLSYSLPSKTWYEWYNRISWAPGLTANINYDFIKPTNSYFQISPSLNFNINNFFKLTFSATSRNSSVYWYFQNTGKYTGNDFYGNNFASRLAADLLQSTGIYGINGWGWENNAFRKNRETSGFKLKSLNLTLTHQLHDWDFNMTWKFEPKVVKKNGVDKYVYDPYISIGIVWNPMQSIKTNLTHEYKDNEEKSMWILK